LETVIVYSEANIQVRLCDNGRRGKARRRSIESFLNWLLTVSKAVMVLTWTIVTSMKYKGRYPSTEEALLNTTDLR
jgi:hypothetical protein